MTNPKKRGECINQTVPKDGVLFEKFIYDAKIVAEIESTTVIIREKTQTMNIDLAEQKRNDFVEEIETEVEANVIQLKNMLGGDHNYNALKARIKSIQSIPEEKYAQITRVYRAISDLKKIISDLKLKNMRSLKITTSSLTH